MIVSSGRPAAGAREDRTAVTKARLPEPDHAARRNAFRHRFIGLALECFRRGEISLGKLSELAAMGVVDPEELAQAIDALDLEREGSEPLVPRVP